METKVLYKADKFDVIEADGFSGIAPTDIYIAVLPFERGVDGLPSLIGVIDEYNPMRRGSKSLTAITGVAVGDDPDVLSSAKKKLVEEAGYDAVDTSRWTYLGEMTTNKFVMDSLHCFAVDVTGLRRKPEPEGDGTLQSDKSEFKFLSVQDALNVEDCYIPAIFMRCFKYVFSNEMKDKKEDNKEEE